MANDNTEELIRQIQKTRQELESNRQSIETDKLRIEKLKQEFEEKNASLSQKREDILRQANEEAKEIFEGNDIENKLWACHNGFVLPDIIASGKSKTKYHKWDVSFGHADYHYDYEF